MVWHFDVLPMKNKLLVTCLGIVIMSNRLRFMFSERLSSVSCHCTAVEHPAGLWSVHPWAMVSHLAFAAAEQKFEELSCGLLLCLLSVAWFLQQR